MITNKRKKMLGKIREFFALLGLKVVVSWKSFVEYLKVIRRYYGNPLFRKVDLYLLRCYLQKNPYRISKEYLMRKKESEVHCYGETPLTTLEKIAEEVEILPEDIVYEIGSGRGRSCFWLRCFKKCCVVGVEYVPEFVSIAQKVKRTFDVEGIKFVYRDILDTEISEATVVYFYGTCSETAFILRLIEKLKELPSGAKIITVSYPLTSYAKEPLFSLVKTFKASFTWGEADVYLQVKE